LKYSVVDEGQVAKYGTISALIKHLDDKVSQLVIVIDELNTNLILLIFINEDVDVVPYMFDQEINNLQHMELTSTLFIDPYSILQPWPLEESRLGVTIRPFQLMARHRKIIVI